MIEDILSNAETVGKWILDSYLQEALDQGHILDVKVRGYGETAEQSLEVDVTYINSSKSLFIDLIGNDYLLDMQEFTSGSNINWEPEDMIEYGERIYPSLDRAQTISKLRALRNWQRVVGVPNRRSFNYSSNGRRNSFERFGIREKQDEIEKLTDISNFVRLIVCKLLEEQGLEVS